MELLIIDVGGTDDTPAVISRGCERYPFIRVIRPPETGAPAKR
jgi:glycosyltransferase involved in cell wall biosynthesis